MRTVLAHKRHFRNVASSYLGKGEEVHGATSHLPRYEGWSKFEKKCLNAMVPVGIK